MAAIEPMHQFLVKPVTWLPKLLIPGTNIDISVTNSVVWMAIGALVLTIFFLAAGRRQVVPGRLQAMGEMLYDLGDKTLTGSIIGDKGRPFLPFVMTIFMFVLIMNMLGLFAFTFTPTAQLAVTAALAFITFITVIIIGFVINGPRMWKLFVPSGLPIPLYFFLVPIEIISFLVRPITLAMRLFGNMIGGHVVLFMFASFIIGLAGFALTNGGVAYLGLLGSGVSLAMLVALTALEFIVAFLQAFVFAALICVYLSDMINLDHH